MRLHVIMQFIVCYYVFSITLLLEGILSHIVIMRQMFQQLHYHHRRLVH